MLHQLLKVMKRGQTNRFVRQVVLEGGRESNLVVKLLSTISNPLMAAELPEDSIKLSTLKQHILIKELPTLKR